ncbi:MAG: voltage-dependent potassium channel beta subunit [Planctomycetota bacterium]
MGLYWGLALRLMEYRRLGRSGVRVSAISIGGWLTFGGSIEDDATASILRTALDKGINFIDLADVYARGKAEESAGRALQGLPRHEYVLSSKVFGAMGDGPNDRGLSRKHIMESCERSLRRLGTDYLDIYFCHREDPETPLEETARAMDDLVRQGKVLYWGTSVWSSPALRRAYDLANHRGWEAPAVEQPRFSLLHRDIEEDVQATAVDLGIGLVVWSPLAGGLLTGKYDDGVPEGSRGAKSDWLSNDLNDENRARLRSFSAVAGDVACSPSQLALAWALEQPGISSVITGATDVAQLEQNLGALEVNLDSDTRSRLDELFPGPTQIA